MIKFIVPGKLPILRRNKCIYVKRTRLNSERDSFKDEMVPVLRDVCVSLRHVATSEHVRINDTNYYKHYIVGTDGPVYADINFLEIQQ